MGKTYRYNEDEESKNKQRKQRIRDFENLDDNELEAMKEWKHRKD